jgi:hypothetical protein
VPPPPTFVKINVLMVAQRRKWSVVTVTPGKGVHWAGFWAPTTHLCRLCSSAEPFPLLGTETVGGDGTEAANTLKIKSERAGPNAHLEARTVSDTASRREEGRRQPR